MVYALGIIGFVCGFACGQMALWFLLRHRSREDLLKDKGLKWKYGTLNWLFAIAGAYSFIAIYREYFEIP